MDHVPAVVIGAGVIGLACARALGHAGCPPVIVDRHPMIGMETSSRNSEVIHAGIYYPQNSVKARLCVEGKAKLYAFCDTHNVPYKRLGKFIVATTPSDIQTLENICLKAANCGVTDLTTLSPQEVKNIEPELQTHGAVFSPSTGIIDSHQFMLALQGSAEDFGASLALKTTVLDIEPHNGLWKVTILDDQQAFTFTTNKVINAAGLYASDVAERIAGLPTSRIPKTRYARGCYFSVQQKITFQHLIYPVPEPGGLGVHLTLDMAGQARFGPDVEWIDDIDYTVDPARSERFYAAIRRYWPALQDQTLQPAYAGIRPKICGPDDEAADFMIQGPDQHGLDGLVNLYGIESPGLTASLAIADLVINDYF